ncbi:sodium/glutamate symporter [Planctomycetota bacterium]
MAGLVILCVLLGLGHVCRSKVKLLQRLYLPSCVVGGLLGLICVQGILLLGGSEDSSPLYAFVEEICQTWRAIPGFLINVVFACLFLGVALPKASELWKRAGPQVVYGQMVAWGQYVVGLGAWVLVLGHLFPDLPGMFAGILPVGFEGGHGTAAGMGPVFAERGWEAGTDLALSSATFGILSAIIVGTGLINWAVRSGHVEHVKQQDFGGEYDTAGIIPCDRRPSAGKLSVNADAIESFSLHLVAVGLAIGVGMLLKLGLVAIEGSSVYLTRHKLLSSFPLFPLCMLGGLLMQWLEIRFDRHRLIDLGLIRRIQNSSLDFLVVAAIATIRVKVVAHALVPLLILVVLGIGWNVACVVLLARRVFKDAWFERAIAEMGQSMGVTASGLLLLRIVDPDYETAAADAFACKQIIHEPFMGGGLWTSTAIPLIAIYGPARVLWIALGAMGIWTTVLVAGRYLRRGSNPLTPVS